MEAEQQVTLNTLDSRQLPVLPPGIPYLLETLTDESIDFQQLSLIIERFPTIAARLIALANSVWSSPVSPVTSLEAACSRIGFAVVRSTSIALAVAAPFNAARCPAFDASRFWCRALLVAEVSNQLAQASDKELSPETARAAGLLHNLGLLLLADQLPQETHQVLQQHRDTPDCQLGQLLFERLGFDYTDAGGFLGEEWGLPAPLITAMENHRQSPSSFSTGEYACIVSYAAAMAQAAEQQTSWTAPDSMQLSLGISPEVSEALFVQVNDQLTKTRELTDTLFGS